jgi:hypothetical protein
MNTAMTSEVETDKFRRMWIKKFDEQAQLHGRRLPRDHWEGSYAYRELDNADNLWMVLPGSSTGDAFFSFLMEKLSRELWVYKIFGESVVTVNQCFGDGIEALSAAETKLTNVRTEESRAKTEVDSTLGRYKSVLERARRSLERRRASYWEDDLIVPIEERMTRPVYVDDEKQVRSIPPEERTKSEKMFENARYPRTLVRQIDLDRRFQLRVALILRSYLPQDSGTSLRTISRMTVLTYICGKLRVEGPNRLFLKPDVKGGEISVGGVDQKLRDAGMK